jgi:hypothetical protein
MATAQQVGVVPEFARAARHINKFRMLARITFFICVDFAILTSLGNGLQAEGLHHASRRGLRHLVLEMPPLRLLSPQRLQNHTARLLSTASSVPEYLCTVPEECLNAMLPRLEFDARFRDVLVGVSVQGQARTQDGSWLRHAIVTTDFQCNLPLHNAKRLAEK